MLRDVLLATALAMLILAGIGQVRAEYWEQAPATSQRAPQ